MKIPKRLIVGYRKQSLTGHNIKVAVPTEIRMSNRTKNSAFKIEKEAQWKKRIDPQQAKIQVRNEFRDGFEIREYYESYRSTRSNIPNFYVWNETFGGYISLTPRNAFNLIQTCVINKGVIQNELIFDGSEFLTKETLIERTSEADNDDTNFNELKESMSDHKVLARNLVPGMVYQEPLKKKYPTAVTYIAYIGQVEDRNGNIYHVTKNITNTANYSTAEEGRYLAYTEPMPFSYGMRSSNRPEEKKIQIPDFTGIRFEENGGAGTFHQYKGVGLAASPWGSLRYRKILPSHYTPSDTKLKDINMMNGFQQEDYDLIDFLLKNPSMSTLNISRSNSLKIIKGYQPQIEGDIDG